MFGSLTQGSTLFVLDKTGDEPKLKIATVSTTTNPNGGNLAWMQPLPGQTVDASVTYPDGETNKFERLPCNCSVFAYDKAIVTETRELMQQQIETAQRQSQAVLESVPYHQRALGVYETIMKQLSPTYAKERQTEERLDVLERGLGDIKDLLKSMAAHSSSAKNQKTD